MNEIRIIIEGLKELTEAINALAGVKGGQMPVGAQAPYQQTAQQTSVPTAGQNYGAGAGPMAAAVPVQQPVPVQPQPAPVQSAALPIATVTPGYSLEQLQVAAAGLTSMGKMPQIVGILQRFGIQAMTELPKERYGEFAAALREAGAQI